MSVIVTGDGNLYKWNVRHKRSMNPRKKSEKPPVTTDENFDAEFPSAEDDPLSKSQREELARCRPEDTKEKFSGEGGVESPKKRSESAETHERLKRGRRPAIPRRNAKLMSATDTMFSPSVSEAWNDFVRSQEVRGLSDSSIEQMGRVARHFCEVVGEVTLWELSLTDVDDYVVWMRRKGNSPSTINTNLQWVKAFLNWCVGKGKEETGGFDAARYARAFDPGDVKNVKQPMTQKRIADPAAVQRLVESLDDSTFDGLRFKTSVLLILDTGVRAGEVCPMDVGDCSADASSLRVFGKGSKERTVYLSKEMTEHLRAWLAYRRRALEFARMEDNPVLFPSLTGARQISVQIGDLFRSRCKLAKIVPAVTAHGLRHLWATNHVKSGTNAFVLKQLGGWATMQIVTTYISEVGGDEAALANQNASLVGNIVGKRVPRRQSPEGKGRG